MTNAEVTHLLLQLERGRQLFIGPSAKKVETLDFASFDIEIVLPVIEAFRARGGDADETTFSELLTFVRDPASRNMPEWNKYNASFHWRLIHPLTFLIMPILAVAMGVTGRRRASNLKPIVGIAVLIVYHEFLEEWGQVVAAKGEMSPWISMWGLLIIFFTVSTSLYIGSIDKARTAKVMARRGTEPIRISAEGALTAEAPPQAVAHPTPNTPLQPRSDAP